MTDRERKLREKLGRLTDAELLRLSPLAACEREAAETSLHAFVKQAWPIVEGDRPFVDNWHLHTLCQHLEAATAGKIPRLLINIPPGCMKSLLLGVFWPAWVWTRNPAARWLFATYTQNLSTRDSVKCRAVISSEWYQRNWGGSVQLGTDQNQKTYFQTRAGGWRLATSVEGRGTGEHPDYIVIDDPHNVQQSESEVQRQAVLDWFDGTISSRGASRGVRKVVIMQRLHEDDLSGHILAKQPDNWDLLCFPMRYEGPGRMPVTSVGVVDERKRDGELLWPDVFPESSVAQLERDMGSRRSAGQLQQRPAPVDGCLFQRSWFRIVPHAPPPRKAIRYWDLAGSEGHGDYSVGVLILKEQSGFFVQDVVRGQWSIHKRNQIVEQTAARDAQQFGSRVSVRIEQEPGASGIAASEYLLQMLARYSSAGADRVDQAKELRWEPWMARLEGGDVYLVRGAWNDAFIQEHLIAPNGRHDDQLDAASGAFTALVLNPGIDLEKWMAVM